MNSEVTVFSDSDWAGDKESRNLSSAGVALVGQHLLEAYTKKAEKHRQKQCRNRAVCSSMGNVRSERGPEHDVRLGFCREASVDH